MSLNIDVYFDEQIGSAFDEITSIYIVRNARSSQYMASVNTFADLDTRIRKILTYLLANQSITRDITLECLDEALGLELGYDSDVFASAVAAFASGDVKWIGQIVDGYLSLEHGRMGLVHALTWLPWQVSSPWLVRFLSSKDLKHKWLAVSVCALLGRLQVPQLQQLIRRQDCQQDEMLFERLLFTAGQLKDTSLHPILREATEHDNHPIQISAHWARWMLDDRNFFNHIAEFSLDNNDAFERLSPWIVLGRPLDESKTYISTALKHTDLADDLLVHAIGMHGDPSVLPWLIQNYKHPLLARWLSMAVYQITGIDIEHPSLVCDEPDDLDEMDADELGYQLEQDTSLPYPDTQKLLEMCHRVAPGFAPNTRYVLGNPVKQGDPLNTRQTNTKGILRKYTSVQSALKGQLYLPYNHVSATHLAASAQDWLR